MKNLKRVELYNFQSHEYTNLDLNDGVNVIIGPSDSGKTAIIRGIKWLLFNEPSGIDFIRNDTNEAKVVLYFQDNTIIERVRSKSKNYYRIIYNDGRVERFEGFGTKVPQEVIEITEIIKVNIDGNNLISLNISDQLESPFLLTESPSVKANAIGRIAGVEKIDLALGKLTKDINEINAEKKSLKKEKTIQLEKIKKFNYLIEEENKLNYVEKLLKQIESKEMQLEVYKKLIKEYIKINSLVYNISLELEKYLNIMDLDKNIIVLNDKISKYYLSINFFEQVNKVEKNILNEEKILKKTSNNDIVNKIVGKLLVKYPQINFMKNINHKLKYLNDNIDKANIIIKKTENINILTNMCNDITNKINKYSFYKNLELNLNFLTNKINKIELIFKNDKTNQLLIIYNKLNDINKLFNKTNELENKLKNIDSRIKNGNIYMEKFIDINEFIKIKNKIEQKTILLIAIKDYYKLLDSLNKKINISNSNINFDIKNTNELISEYIKLLRKSLICPYCLSKLDEEHLSKIISEFGV